MLKLAITVSILLVTLINIQDVRAQYPDPTVDLGTTGDFLWKEGDQYGRTAILMPIGPWIYNAPEGPGSTETNIVANGGVLNLVDNMWEFSDLAAPTMVREFTTATQTILAHGSIARYGTNGARLINNGVGYNPLGATFEEQLIVDQIPNNLPYWPTWSNAYSHMSSPYSMRNFWEYQNNNAGLVVINNSGIIAPNDWVLEGVTEPRWRGIPYIYWDHFAVSPTTGFQMFSGNLLVFGSDQRNTGLTVYDISGMKEGRIPRLLSVFNPVLTQPDGSPVGIGGYWVEQYGANKAVWSARNNSSNGRTSSAMYIVDFEDPVNPQLTCEVYFDQVRTTQGWLDQPDIANDVNSGDGDVSSDPMYVNFQDNYAYLDHFKVDIQACEQAMAANIPVTGAVFDSIVTKFDDIVNGCESSQYFRPMGQMGIFGGYDFWRTRDVNEQGMCGFVTSDTPDTNPPYISGHRPLANQTEVPIDTFIHIHIPETLRTESLENNAITITNTTTNVPIEFFQQLSHTGTISIWPKAYLTADTVYLVAVSGVQDFMGNTIVPYSYTFTTDDGDLLKGETRFPVIDINNPPPAPTIAIPVAPVGPTPTYAGPIYAPNNSSQLFCDASTESNNVWAVNPDNDTVTIIGSSINNTSLVKNHNVIREISTLYENPSSVTKVLSEYAVTYRDDDKVVFFNAAGDTAYALDTGHGTQPIASVGDGNYLYVALYGSGEVVKINLSSRTIVDRLNVGPHPRAMAMTGNRLLVTRYISPSTHGEVYDINTTTMTLSRTLIINKLLIGDDIDHGGGLPNLLSGIVINQANTFAYISASKANIDRGLRPGSTNPQSLDSDNTVRPMMATIDLINNRDTNTDPLTREGTLDLDNKADPSAISYIVNPNVRVLAFQGNDIIILQNEQTNSTAQFDTGSAPQSVCSTRRTLYVKNFTGRSVTAIDISEYLDSGSIQQIFTEIPTVSNEVLPAQELLGLQLFYKSLIPEMGEEGYMSCATCHADSGHDGQTWDFVSLGEGLRNTISLNGSSGVRFGLLHWSQNFDELQDFEFQILELNGGVGLSAQEDGTGGYVPSRLVGQSPLTFTTAGLSNNLDALAAYMSGLGRDTVKRSPYRTFTGNFTAEALRGRDLFRGSIGGEPTCSSCHSGPAYRDGLGHDVGTITIFSGNKSGLALTEIRTPTLIELWDSAPYFHDGSAATLEDVMNREAHSRVFTGTQQQDLIEYLLSIDRETFITDDADFATEDFTTNPENYRSVGEFESTANITIRGIPNGLHNIKLYNNTESVLLFSGNINFSNSNASIFINVPIGTVFTGRYLGTNPPTTVISLFGTTN